MKKEAENKIIKSMRRDFHRNPILRKLRKDLEYDNLINSKTPYDFNKLLLLTFNFLKLPKIKTFWIWEWNLERFTISQNSYLKKDDIYLTPVFSSYLASDLILKSFFKVNRLDFSIVDYNQNLIKEEEDYNNLDNQNKNIIEDENEEDYEENILENIKDKEINNFKGKKDIKHIDNILKFLNWKFTPQKILKLKKFLNLLQRNPLTKKETINSLWECKLQEAIYVIFNDYPKIYSYIYENIIKDPNSSKQEINFAKWLLNKNNIDTEFNELIEDIWGDTSLEENNMDMDFNREEEEYQDDWGWFYYEEKYNNFEEEDNDLYYEEEEEYEENDFINRLIKNIIISIEEFKSQIQNDNMNKSKILDLVFKTKEWDMKATEEISLILLKEATSLSKKFSTVNWVYDEQLASDLIQEAVLSGMKWISKYDINKNDNFIYYIRHWLILGIYNYLNTHYSAIRVPSHIKQLKNKIQKIIRDENIDSPENNIDKITDIIYQQSVKNSKKRVDDIKDLIKENPKNKKELEDKIKKIQSDFKEKHSIDRLRGKIEDAILNKTYSEVYSMEFLLKNLEDWEENARESLILEDKENNIIKNLISKEEEEKLKKFLQTILNEEELLVIMHRFKIFWEDELLLDTLWKKFNKSAERVRQIYNNAIQKLSIKTFDEYMNSLHYSSIDNKFYINERTI